jgi:histidine triad (HIT) family protein
MSPDNCLFCRIIRKEIPANIALETDQVLAFHDLHPQAPTHILVIPKVHTASLDALVAEDNLIAGELLLAVARVAREAHVAESGYRIVANTGEHAGQSVPHLHFHVLGGRRLNWPPG